MKIRRVKLQDIEKLKELSKLTFVEAFASDNSEENMKQYLESEFSTEKLSSELLDPNSEFYFGEIERSAVGYLKINIGQSQTENQDQSGLEIERIYLLSEYYGKNLGQNLLDYAIELAKIKRMEYVWLGVWERNLRAIRFYEKNGFQAFNKHIFKLGKDEQVDIMMKLEMK